MNCPLVNIKSVTLTFSHLRHTLVEQPKNQAFFNYKKGKWYNYQKRSMFMSGKATHSSDR